MHYFLEKDGELWAEDMPVRELVRRYGTPLYIYSAATLKRHFQAFDMAFADLPHLTCFSVKCNSNISILNLLQQEGAGADIVSGGELFRALRAGIAPEKIVFSGVGKQAHEIEAALEAGILMFNVESVQELHLINELAKKQKKKAPVALRINPDVDPKTHPYISTGLAQNKFGINMAQAEETYLLTKKMDYIDPVGLDCHIGSQLTEISPFLEALDRLLLLYSRLKDQKIDIRFLDLGGGLGITYSEEDPPHPKEFGLALTQILKDYPLTLILEPGRVIAGNAGILVTRVLFVKQGELKEFVVVDAAMNDLIRPSLYGAFHRIAEVRPQKREPAKVDIVGPICESGDFLAKDRELPRVRAEELLAVFSAGAYGFTMSSQYNSRPRAAEILVTRDQDRVIRRRETYQDLTALEEEYLK